ncbi:MAG TPA: type II toxin-antitoxin system HicA family toxin [Candidatus Nanoarchaeia archaeon]|nr:type II toxin-antitoxin system HicA family toxin [Candidatus Nanoarchaeia archaeon]
MRRLKTISGRECVKILCKHFGFQIIRRRGSHIVLGKQTPGGSIGTVVPDHKELRIGTLKALLEMASVLEEEFAEYQ